VGALQEALGFALPRVVREALAVDRERRPPVARPRGPTVPDAERPRFVDTFPTWDSVLVVLPDGERSRWGLRLEQEQPLGAADLGEGTYLEILGGSQERGVGVQRVEYRLTHQGRVVFAGDDIHAPAGADLGTDESLRAVMSMLLDRGSPAHSRGRSPSQQLFVEARGDDLLSLLETPHPYPEGTRVIAVVDGVRHTGKVTYAATARGETLGYAWRPDTADLVGHPWRHHDELSLTSPPEELAATLAPAFVASPPPGTPLVFGAIVSAAHPETGERVEATVLRAFADDRGSFVYQLQPNAPDLPESFVVAEVDCALVQGTWWPSTRQLLEARKAAGIEAAPGEVFAANDNLPLSVVGDGYAEPPEPSPDRRAAALAVDIGDTAPVSIHGRIARVRHREGAVILVEAERWMAAMTKSPADLVDVVRAAAPSGTLRGDEAKPVLAALAVRHAPDAFGPAPEVLLRSVGVTGLAEVEAGL
jgi:hypothetical protein